MKYQIITYNKRGDRKQATKDLSFEECLTIYRQEKEKGFPRPTIWENNGKGNRVEGY